MTLRTLWADRPWLYSRPVWALVLALDVLPWPWGEDILTRLFSLVALVKASRRRPALAWAAQQPGCPVWRTALAVTGFRGRWVARSTLLGVRHPDDLRARTVLEGAEHLTPTDRGTILLTLHLGPPSVDVAMRTLGHRVAWLGTHRTSRAWARPAWRPFLEAEDNLAPKGKAGFWPGYLYRARRLLLDGGTVCVTADPWVGRELFEIPLLGATLTIRAGWFSLCRQTGARVLPVLSHLEGRVQVIRVLPPLPANDPDEAAALAGSREALSALARDYVARYAEQCPGLVFGPQRRPREARVDTASPAEVPRP